MVLQQVSKTFSKVFGSRNDRMLKTYTRRVGAINQIEPEVRQMTDDQLRKRTAEFRQQIADGTPVSELMPQMLATAREVMDRSVGIRNIFNPEHGFDPSVLPHEAKKLYEKTAAQIAELEPEPVRGGEPAPPWMQVEIPVALYEAVRQWQERSRPPFRARPFDVQLIGGMVIGEGRIAEMKTGEGKTIVAPLACYVAAVEGMQCHVVTTNDYLVQRDRDWVFPFYYWLGMTVGAIHPQHMQPPQLKQEAYTCDVLYATNSELGFDYLRDNMKLATGEQMQKRRDFCIVDEIDSILIDEARTPLIISGPAHDDAPRYGLADKIAAHLMQQQRQWDAAEDKVQQALMRIKGLEGDIRNARDKAKVPEMRQQLKELQEQLPQLEEARDRYTQFYEIERDKKAAHLTHDGVAEAQKQAGIGSFYVGNNMDFPHLLENALRAHAVYQRDKDYVVQGGEVVIVDEFTGRLMVGRQWSDGLHQAVEAKERVKIKQETQTLATITIQNFFKLYKRLAGMTGTAITEATEFYEIYKLDVVCIPTNVPIARNDRDDLIFLSVKDKWNAIADEVKRVHDIGRPVLVGTTSVEKSEMLSQLLTKRHSIQHSVLNAKAEHAEREAHTVEHAGEIGAVMIATNMAGRGTDIKLRQIPREDLVRHWQQRNLLPRQADPKMSDDQLIDLACRHLATLELGIKPKQVEDMSSDDVQLQLLRKWVVNDAWIDEKKADAMSAEDCRLALDKLPEYYRHRLKIYKNIEEMGGLHIIGTERHEARRIDNQLRGRAGRQGDNGSSRFFLALDDDLMKMFAGKTTMAALSKLGMKEGDAIEHRWVSRSVERAQRKVEERNYEIRKNLLEYDEVMEYQRTEFYNTRQAVLEGRRISDLVFDYISDAVEDAVDLYTAKDYTKTQIAEWCRQTLDVSIEPGKLPTDDMQDLEKAIRSAARSEVMQTIDVTLGEYMSNDVPREEWDMRGLQSWAASRFDVGLKMGNLRSMNVDQVRDELVEAAQKQVDQQDLSGVAKYLEPNYAQQQLADWARSKFDIELDPKELAELDPPDVIQQILGKAREVYKQREVSYPVQFMMELIMQGAQQDQQWAVNQLRQWAGDRYELELDEQQVREMDGQTIYDTLLEQSRLWLTGGKLEQVIDNQLAEHGDDAKAMARWMANRFGIELSASERAMISQSPDDEDDNQADDESHGIVAVDDTDADDQEQRYDSARDMLIDKARGALRVELTQLERFVLLQVLDQAWKDHLYSMDQLKDSVGLRGYAERDPRIEYKREGARQFAQMQANVRDRVTDLIFRARLTPNVQLRSVYDNQNAEHSEADSVLERSRQPAQAAASTAAMGSEQQRADMAAADMAGDGQSKQPMSRKQRRAMEAQQRKGGSGGGKRKRR